MERLVFAFFVVATLLINSPSSFGEESDTGDLDRAARMVNECEKTKADISRRLKENKNNYDEISKNLEFEKQQMTNNLLKLHELTTLRKLLQSQNLAASKAFWNAELLLKSVIEDSLRRQWAYKAQMESLKRLEAILEKNLKELIQAEVVLRKNVGKLTEMSKVKLAKASLQKHLEVETDLGNNLDLVSHTATPSVPIHKNLPLPVNGIVESSIKLKKDAASTPLVYTKGVFIKAEEGTEVKAVEEGRVAFAGWFREFGRTVIIDHGDHFFSVITYLGKINIEQGSVVKKGDVVGEVGKNDMFDEVGIYFEWRHNGKPLDIKEWFALNDRYRRE